MKAIYLDNAATSFPKAPSVGEAMKYYIDEVGANINRSSYSSSMDTGMMALSLRQRACNLFGFDDPTHVIITSGATAGLNMVINSYLKDGGHVITSPLEHNAVIRPLNLIRENNKDYLNKRLEIESFPYNLGIDDKYEGLLSLIKENTKAVIMLHSSNVSGEVFDIDKIGEICKEKGLDFIVDAAQTGGHIPIDFYKSNISALVLPGHKGLLGPSGIGLVLMSRDFADKLSPFISGGTGSVSESEYMPTFLPDKFEAGTPNIPGIYGLEKALEFIENTGIGKIHKNISMLRTSFVKGLRAMNLDEIIRISGSEKRDNSGVVSIDFVGYDNAIIGAKLSSAYKIYTRCGLHCAAMAHNALGNALRGSVRFSFGYFNTEEEIDITLNSIREILKV
jgi:possible cysteine desulfurase